MDFNVSLQVRSGAVSWMEDLYKQITDTLYMHVQDQYWIFIRRFWNSYMKCSHQNNMPMGQ
jgi:hypothetical protein